MFPPIAVAVPIFIMYRKLGLGDTHVGMIILYTVVNLSLSVWLLKGFMDEIPREYEEAAIGGNILVDKIKNNKSSFSGTLNLERA